MKKFIIGLLMTIGVIVVSVASAFAVFDYKEKQFFEELSTDAVEDVCPDCTFVANPTILAPYEAISLKSAMVMQNTVDSVYRSIPDDAITTITEVLVGRNGTTTKADIVEEYLRCYRSTYQFIKLQPTTGQQSEQKDGTIVSNDQTVGAITIRADSDTIANVELHKKSHLKVE